MGGSGSGRKPKKPSTEELIEDGVQAASEAAARVPPKKRDYKAERERAKAAKKGVDEKPTDKERKTRKSKYPKPEEFKDNPLAMAMNAFASGRVGMPGLAEKCQLGEAWMAVLDYYTGGVVDHPLAVALVSTGSFAAVVYAVKMNDPKKAGAVKGPGSPAGQNAAPGAELNVLDAQCVHCGTVFPSLELVSEHIAKEHKP